VGRLRLVIRQPWARYAAPALFLLAVTAIVLVVRAEVRSDAAPAKTTAATTSAAPVKRPKPQSAKRFYLIQSGDTLGAIAAQRGTTVAVLLRLNPGIEPTALRPGERLRVP
jgi:LysM repeat protein